MVGMASVDAAAPTGLTVVLVGAESTGKTTLASALASRYQAPWVAEVARDYLTGLSGYDIEDLEQIGRRQLDAEQQSRTAQHRLLLLDTDILVIDIWWRERFGAPPDWVGDALARAARDSRRRYLLCAPDLPWAADPLRENPDDRERLHQRYRRALEAMNATYAEISGHRAARTDAAVAAIDGWLS